MDKQEWLNRCAKRFEIHGGLSPAQAMESAETAHAVDECRDFADDPEGAADSDMSYWEE